MIVFVEGGREEAVIGGGNDGSEYKGSVANISLILCGARARAHAVFFRVDVDTNGCLLFFVLNFLKRLMKRFEKIDVLELTYCCTSNSNAQVCVFFQKRRHFVV